MKFEKYFDHTNLKPDATMEDIRKLCEEAKEYGFASVCVNGAFTAFAKECLAGSDVKTCVVVGFPLGAMSTKAKVFETEAAVLDGADEIDMVLPIGALKSGDYLTVRTDIMAVRNACQGKILKVIFENCLLTENQIMKACEISVESGADYVKTSTGFSNGGATVTDVALMARCVEGRAYVKAAGGIRDYNTAMAMIDAGAHRLGTSATIKIIKERE